MVSMRLVSYAVALFCSGIFGLHRQPRSIDSLSKCSTVEVDKKDPYVDELEPFKTGRVYIPFHVKTKNSFEFRLGRGPYYFIRIIEHSKFMGGFVNGEGEETIMEIFNSFFDKMFAHPNEYTGYFVRLKIRDRYTMVSLFPAGNEDSEVILSFKDEKPERLTRIKEYSMFTTPKGFLKLNCKVSLSERCAFSTDCVTNGSECRTLVNEPSKCRCSDSYFQKSSSECVPSLVQIGSKCISSVNCTHLGAKCREDVLSHDKTMTCQCLGAQVVTKEGTCLDDKGGILFERLHRKNPTYEEMYPGKLPEVSVVREPAKKSSACLLDLRPPFRKMTPYFIPTRSFGFVLRFRILSPIRGAFRMFLSNLDDQVQGELSLHKSGFGSLRYGKRNKSLLNLSAKENFTLSFIRKEPVSSIEFQAGKISSMIKIPEKIGFPDFPSHFSIFTNFPTRILALC